MHAVLSLLIDTSLQFLLLVGRGSESQLGRLQQVQEQANLRRQQPQELWM
jgi:hypothetical protein